MKKLILIALLAFSANVYSQVINNNIEVNVGNNEPVYYTPTMYPEARGYWRHPRNHIDHLREAYTTITYNGVDMKVEISKIFNDYSLRMEMHHYEDVYFIIDNNDPIKMEQVKLYKYKHIKLDIKMLQAFSKGNNLKIFSKYYNEEHDKTYTKLVKIKLNGTGKMLSFIIKELKKDAKQQAEADELLNKIPN